MSWSPPTLRDDGTSLGNLAGYKIYYGTDPSDLSSIVAVNSAGVTSFTVDGLDEGHLLLHDHRARLEPVLESAFLQRRLEDDPAE